MASTVNLLRNRQEKPCQWTMIVIGLLLWIAIAQVVYSYWNEPGAGNYIGTSRGVLRHM